jgi:hypothetical protein
VELCFCSLYTLSRTVLCVVHMSRVAKCGVDLCDSATRACCDYGNERSGTVKTREYLD